MIRANSDGQGALDQLIDAVRNLQMPAHHQICYLSALGVGDCADELGLELDDSIFGVRSIVEGGHLSGSSFQGVLDLSDHLRSFSGASNAELWTFAALEQAAEWEKARELARIALQGLLESEDPGTGDSRG